MKVFFLFDGKYYEQIDGVAMSSPLGPVLANIFMCGFGENWLMNTKISPSFWIGGVDDTFTMFEWLSQQYQRVPNRFGGGICTFFRGDIRVWEAGISVASGKYGRHVARLRRRRRRRCRAYTPTSNAAGHDNHEKINSWVSFSFLHEYGAPLGSLSSAINFVIVFLSCHHSPHYFCIFKCL